LTTRNEYNACGEVSTQGISSNSIGYTGQRLDNETGLMALGNGERYYSPSYARFIQQDSWLGDSQMPQSLNRFAYAYNNPFSYTDPSGNQSVFSNGTKWTRNDDLNTKIWDNMIRQAEQTHIIKKSVLPSNHIELFESSKPFTTESGDILRFAKDADGSIHRFEPSFDNVYPWSGSTAELPEKAFLFH